MTPAGVRDGDPAVLAALVARRGPAVLAFCEAVCLPHFVSHAAAEAFARFRALVVTVDDTAGLDPEVFLLGATRHAAASMAKPPHDDRGMLRVLGRGASPETYAAVPTLLAARADDMLSAEDLDRLTRLLERSAGCREVEAAFRRAERGYRSPPERPVPAAIVDLVIVAMQAAVPVAPGFVVVEAAPAPAPAPDLVEAMVRAAPAEDAGAVPVAPPADEPLAAELLGDHQIVLPEPEPVAASPAEPDGGPEAEPIPWDDVVAEDAPWADDVAMPVTDEQEDYGNGDTAIIPAVPPPGAPARVRRRLPRWRLPHGGGLHLPRSDRDTAQSVVLTDHGPVYRVLLPVATVIIAVLVILAIAGVFGGDTPSAGLLLGP